MLLHLIRHGDAVPAEDDRARPLSPRGREDVLRLAEIFRANPASLPTLIWYSPLRRARETTALLVQRMGAQIIQVSKNHLLPEDDPAKISELIAELPSSIQLAIVGHEPHLSTLATLLVHGRKSPCAFTFEKAGLLTLAPTLPTPENPAQPRWDVRDAWTPFDPPRQ